MQANPNPNSYATFTKTIARDYESAGYRMVDPSSFASDLPKGFVPDLMFEKKNEVIVIEIKTAQEHRSLEHIRMIKDAIEQRPKWRYKLFVAPAESGVEPEVDQQDLEERIDLAQDLSAGGKYEEASVVLWMAIEASLRAMLTNRQSRPNPGVSGMSMARSLLGFGDLSPEDVELLKEAFDARNRSVHGYQLDTRAPISDELLRLARKMAHTVEQSA